MKASSLQHLHALRMQATQAGYDMAEQRSRFQALANRHEDGTAPRAVTAFNLFQTPEPVAARMADMVADHLAQAGTLEPRILEPSAGLGRIARALRSAVPAARLSLVDSSPECAAELRRTAADGDRVTEGDFLELAPEIIGPMDAVCMNPPFKLGRDVQHIRHAREMLKPGGLLVALCYDGTRQNEKLRPECDTWEPLPPNTFAAEGTRADVVLLTIRRHV